MNYSIQVSCLIMNPLQPEEENYVRFSLLLTGISPRAARALFDKEFAPVRLSASLKKEYNKLNDLKLKRIINQPQWNLLFPRNGDPVSEDFDIQLVICLLRHLTDITEPSKGYDQLPPEGEKTPAADLARIKYYRNRFAHLRDAKVDDIFFNKAWGELANAIERLGGSAMKQECDDLKGKILDSNKDTVPWNIREQMNQELEIWKENDQMFVETTAACHVLQRVKENSFIYVTGSSGVGKTATVRHVALVLKEEEGYDIVPVKKPSDVIKFTNSKKNILFVIDDFCGTHTLNNYQLDEWKTHQNEITKLLERNNIKILVSCRLQVYRDVMLKVLKFYQSCECNLLSDNIRLSKKEKEFIAKMYLPEVSLDIPLSSPFDFFPFLCKFCNTNRKINVEDFFKNPLSVFETEMKKLYEDGGLGKYCALALCVMFNNEVDEHWLTEEISKDMRKVFKNTCEACKLDRGTSRLVIRDEMNSLIDTFLIKEKGIYHTTHNMLFDFLSHYFGSSMIQCLIKNATSRFISERFLIDKSGENDHFTISVPDEYQEMYIRRVFDDWSNGEVVDVFRNNNFNEDGFRVQFLKHFNSFDPTHQKYLAQKCNIRVTTLFGSCGMSDIDIFGWCKTNGCYVKDLVDGLSPLNFSSSNGQIKIVLNMLTQTADITCMISGISSLYLACQNGNKDIVEQLLKAGADCKQCGMWGVSPLCVACENGSKDIVELLLKAGADCKQLGLCGLSPLYITCQTGNKDILELLLKAGADYTQIAREVGLLLRIACRKNDKDMVDILLKAGADCTQSLRDARLLLVIAVENGNKEIVELLLKAGADCTQCDIWGVSPLHHACEKSNKDIVELLLKAGADRKQCDIWGVWPFSIAYRNGNKEIAELLLKAGAD